jgi:hypothetical protein
MRLVTTPPWELTVPTGPPHGIVSRNRRLEEEIADELARGRAANEDSGERSSFSADRTARPELEREVELPVRAHAGDQLQAVVRGRRGLRREKPCQKRRRERPAGETDPSMEP